MSIKETDVYRIQSLMAIKPEAQVVELHVAKKLEMRIAILEKHNRTLIDTLIALLTKPMLSHMKILRRKPKLTLVSKNTLPNKKN